MSDVLQEVEQRERRRSNIMIFELPEMTDTLLTDRQGFDKTIIRVIFDEAGVICVSRAIAPGRSNRGRQSSSPKSGDGKSV